MLHDVALTLHPGRVTALLGPNGSGKSTLLRVLLGLHRPDTGSVHLSGRPLDRLDRVEIARHLAYVPQHTTVAFAYTAFEVVLMARVSRQRFHFSPPAAADRLAAAGALDRMGASGLAHRVYSTLSGGERQLVLIARALAQEAPVLVMDEPVTGLDYGNQIHLLALVSRLARELGKSVLLTTHTPEHALAVADEVVLLKAGRLVAQGSPVGLLTPETLARLYGIPPERLARFLCETRLPGPTEQSIHSLSQKTPGDWFG